MPENWLQMRLRKPSSRASKASKSARAHAPTRAQAARPRPAGRREAAKDRYGKAAASVRHDRAPKLPSSCGGSPARWSASRPRSSCGWRRSSARWVLRGWLLLWPVLVAAWRLAGRGLALGRARRDAGARGRPRRPRHRGCAGRLAVGGPPRDHDRHQQLHRPRGDRAAAPGRQRRPSERPRLAGAAACDPRGRDRGRQRQGPAQARPAPCRGRSRGPRDLALRRPAEGPRQGRRSTFSTKA